MLQVFLWIKVLTNATIKAFLDSSFQKSNFLFILLQPAARMTSLALLYLPQRMLFLINSS